MADPGVGIGIAIIGIILRVVIRMAMKDRRESQFAGGGELDEATRRLLATPAFDARAETRDLSIGADQATLMLFDIEGAVTVDGVEVALPPLAPRPAEPTAGGYRDVSSGALGRTLAIVRICPGRHTVLTRSGARLASIDVFLHPQEVWARRVPVGEGTWEEVGSGDIERARRGMTEGTTAAVVSGFGSVIWETRAKGGLENAITQTQLALAIVPDEPRLLALLGETEKALGRDKEARVHLERALARGKQLGATSLDASWTARVEAALA